MNCTHRSSIRVSKLWRAGLAALFSLLALASSATIAQEAFPSVKWRYSTSEPGDGWQNAAFQDSQWQEGSGGFGEPSTPGARVATPWKSADIWLRRSLPLTQVPTRPLLLVHHDEDAEIYINGKLASRLSGYTSDYQVVEVSEEARQALQAGDNLLAVHCHQTNGGQYIDVHLLDGSTPDSLPSFLTKPFQTDLTTTWGEKVTAENAWQDYPRPQLVRPQWTNLNGLWDYAITSVDDAKAPSVWRGQILVPFSLESKLSGVSRLLQPFEAIWYRRTFDAKPAADRRQLLHFEAVDYRCQVWVNGKPVGEHVGGNLPFSFDVTSAVQSGPNELVVRVEDATGGAQLRGKQVLSPSGIYYTRVSGIWQTVWMEDVPARSIASLRIVADAKSGAVQVVPRIGTTANLPDDQLRVRILDGDREVASATGTDRIRLAVPQPQLWSPDSPKLYDVVVSLVDNQGKTLDEVRSYFAFRSVGREQDADGNWRFTLNEKPIFHWGPLDQGWWPDGLLTPPSDEAIQFEIDYLKKAGFNMIRKHIKVEPQRYYYHCDRMGMLVWQDQVSGGKTPPWTFLEPNPTDAEWSHSDHQQFMRELSEMIDLLEHFPSIVVWTPFNEAWGQHRTMEVGQWVMERDPSRLVNIASGGNFWPTGHIADLHRYPHPDFPLDDPRFKDYIRLVGEFGGHGWPVQNHLWNNSPRNWGYGGLPQSLEEYKERYRISLERLGELKAKGVAAGVYTQTTDVEGEINGLMTYDRKVSKIPVEELRAMAEKYLK